MCDRTQSATGASIAKTLIVSWGLRPSLSGSTVVVENLADQFSADEVVIAGQRPSEWRPTDRRVTGPRTYHVTREWTWPRRGRRFVHWVRWLLFPIVAWRLVRIIRHEGCSAILAVFPNEFFLFAAYVAARITNCRFYPYFHNTYLENRRGFARLFAKWLQRRVFAAETVFVMSEGMQRFYERHYPGVCFVPLLHSYVENLETGRPPSTLHDPLRFAFLGNLGDSNRDAAIRCAELVKSRPNSVLTICTGTADWVFAKAGISGPAFRITRVPDDRLTLELRKNDILLLPHGFDGALSDVEYATIFPTRTIAYLLAGRPILAHAPPHAFLTRWLRENECAEIVDEPSLVQLSQALDRLVANPDRREELVRNGYQALRQFHVSSVVHILREHLRPLCTDKRDNARGVKTSAQLAGAPERR